MHTATSCSWLRSRGSLAALWLVGATLALPASAETRIHNPEPYADVLTRSDLVLLVEIDRTDVLPLPAGVPAPAAPAPLPPDLPPAPQRDEASWRRSDVGNGDECFVLRAQVRVREVFIGDGQAAAFPVDLFFGVSEEAVRAHWASYRAQSTPQDAGALAVLHLAPGGQKASPRVPTANPWFIRPEAAASMTADMKVRARRWAAYQEINAALAREGAVSDADHQRTLRLMLSEDAAYGVVTWHPTEVEAIEEFRARLEADPWDRRGLLRRFWASTRDTYIELPIRKLVLIDEPAAGAHDHAHER